jgi:hypothetical protein
MKQEHMTDDSSCRQELQTDILMFAEHYQFYVFDSQADPGELSVFWDEESKERLLLITDTVLGIGTARHLDVPVEVVVLLKEPQDEPLDDYDQVIECSLHVPSGAIKISSATEDMYEAKGIPLIPGSYGVRVFWGALSEVDEEGFEGEDFYKIALWPTQKPPELKLLKRWKNSRRLLY